MAYTIKTWENRNTKFKNLRTLTPVTIDGDTASPAGDSLIYQVDRYEDAIYTTGDPINAENMNNLERRVSDGFLDAEQYTDTQVTSLRNTVNTLNAQNVKLTGAQTISDVKTFSSVPLTTGGDPQTNNALSRKAYVDSQASAAQSAATSAANTAVQNAKVWVKTASVTNTGWTSGSGYYQKTTGQTVPTGYNATYVGVNILDDSTAVNLSQSIFIRAISSNGTVFLRVGAVPNGTINIGLTFILTRTS